MITDSSVGKLFTRDGEDVWECVTFCQHPTATMKSLRTGETLGGATHSPNLSGFSRLVKKGMEE